MTDITPISLLNDDDDNLITHGRTVIEIEDSDDADDSDNGIYQQFNDVDRSLFGSTPDTDSDTPESDGLDDIRNIASFAVNPYINALWDDNWPRLDELVAKIHESNTLGSRLFAGLTEDIISDTGTIVRDAMKGLGEIARRLSKYNVGKGDREPIISSENEENPAIKLALRHASLLTANPNKYTNKLGRSNCHARSLDITLVTGRIRAAILELDMLKEIIADLQTQADEAENRVHRDDDSNHRGERRKPRKKKKRRLTRAARTRDDGTPTKSGHESRTILPPAYGLRARTRSFLRHQSDERPPSRAQTYS